MVEHRPWGNLFAHSILILGVALVLFPVYIAIVASTQGPGEFLRGTLPLVPGSHALDNYRAMWETGLSRAGAPPAGQMLWNSLVMALAITFGKLSISLLSAFAIVYFRFPFRLFFFITVIAFLLAQLVVAGDFGEGLDEGLTRGPADTAPFGANRFGHRHRKRCRAGKPKQGAACELAIHPLFSANRFPADSLLRRAGEGISQLRGRALRTVHAYGLPAGRRFRSAPCPSGWHGRSCRR